MPLVEALLDDGTDEGGAVEQHPFIALKVKRITLFSPVARIIKYWCDGL